MRISTIWLVISLSILISLSMLSACNTQQSENISIVGIRTANGIDDDFMPIDATNVFPKGTSKVFCWFKWRNAKVNTQIIARWVYVTDDINILDYPFAVPKKEGSGSVTLSMPEGKALPSGLYRVDLTLGEDALRSRNFKVK